MIKQNYLIFFLAFFVISCNNSGQNNNSIYANHLNKYELVKDWPNLPKEFKLGNPTGIGIDTNQNVFVFHRADREWAVIGTMPTAYISSKTILMLDRESGKILKSWGDSLFIMPHGLTIDIQNNVWVTDVGLHQIFKFAHDGKLLMKLGEAKVSGNDATHFNRPTDIAVAKDGSFYVSDGYGNSRIVKFSAAGKYLFEWGKKGDKEGEFNVPHAISLDDKENIYVADRENKRVQVFNATGKFIKQWTNKGFGRICSVVFNKQENNFIAVDDATSWFNIKHNGSNIILFDSTGNVIDKFGNGFFKRQGIKCWYHDVAVDNEGSIYVEDIINNKLQKFKKQ